MEALVTCTQLDSEGLLQQTNAFHDSSTAPCADSRWIIGTESGGSHWVEPESPTSQALSCPCCPPNPGHQQCTSIVPHAKISTRFFPNANLVSDDTENIILVSADDVYFFAHTRKLLAASTNGFGGLLTSESPETPVWVPESSTLLNILLHVIYDLPLIHYNPTIVDLTTAVDAFGAFGLSLQAAIAPSSSVFKLLMTRALAFPLEVYTLAASNDIAELATLSSAYLLSFSLASLTEDQASKIGSKYLRRLFFLHLGRIEALKRLLLQPPPFHVPKNGCSIADQTGMVRAWALASAYISWDAKPGVWSCTQSSTSQHILMHRVRYHNKHTV
jgi:hypothetical protein